jgi:glucuronate isomerase
MKSFLEKFSVEVQGSADITMILRNMPIIDYHNHLPEKYSRKSAV